MKILKLFFTPIVLLLLSVFVPNLFWTQVLYSNNTTSNFNPNTIVAKVDSITITAEEFYFSYEFGPAFIKRLPNSKQKHLDYLINEKLLALEGYSLNFEDERLVSNSLNAFRDDIASE
jgi:hypothetical protein